MFQNLWITSKAVLRGKFKKQEKSQITNLTVHLKQPEKDYKKKNKENPKSIKGMKL